jgi:hypothetical protein
VEAELGEWLINMRGRGILLVLGDIQGGYARGRGELGGGGVSMRGWSENSINSRGRVETDPSLHLVQKFLLSA